jgi:hypothetical protein
MAEGLLTQPARQAAVRASLNLLSAWFERGDPATLARAAALSPGAGAQDPEFAWALRLRVTLAQARRMEGVLHAIAHHPSFRYSQVADEAIGAVRGHLDLQRYLKQRARRDVPPRYPIRVVERNMSTPENILLMYAVGSLVEVLRGAPAASIPTRSREALELTDRLSSLTRTLHHPTFHGALEQARNVARRDAIDDLVEAVEQRLASARVANVEAYQLLLDLLHDIRTPFEGAGDTVEWLGHDARFDTRLYEIWTLQLTHDALVRAFNDPDVGPRALTTRGKDATSSWRIASAILSLHFQPPLSALGNGDPVWIYTDPDNPLSGYPDVACIIEERPRPKGLVIVDAKLRQRESPPAEELYKLLGYFENLPHLTYPAGAIVFYSPGNVTSRKLKRAGGGQALLIGADPEMPSESASAFDDIVQLVLAAAETVVPNARAAVAERGSPGSEQTLSAIQNAASQTLAVRASQLPKGTLDIEARRLATQLGQGWASLDDQTRRMIATASYFGFHAADDFDYSGPLLGLCAACERLISEHVLAPMQQDLGDEIVKFTTIGVAAHLARRSARPRRYPDHDVQSWLLDRSRTFDGEQFVRDATLFEELRDDRNAAAHIELIDAERFDTGYKRILDAQNGALVRLIQMLHLT